MAFDCYEIIRTFQGGLGRSGVIGSMLGFIL